MIFGGDLPESSIVIYLTVQLFAMGHTVFAKETNKHPKALQVLEKYPV